jgi:hypothetical protein
MVNGGDGTIHNIDSKIYKWNGTSFVEIQAILTNGAIDWETKWGRLCPPKQGKPLTTISFHRYTTLNFGQNSTFASTETRSVWHKIP